MAGAANSWPFEFAGMEHEITDPANLYFLPGSNVYNPQLQLDLSQVGPQGLGGPGGAGPSGSPAAAPGGSSGGGAGAYFNAGNIAEQDAISVGIQNAVTNGVSELATLIASETLGAAAGPIGLAASAIYDLFTIFDDIFGGGGSPPIPRQLMHRRHPLYGQIIGIDSGLIPTEASACKLCADPHPCRKAPLQKAAFMQDHTQPEYHRAPAPTRQEPVPFGLCAGTFAAFSAPAIVGCGVYGIARANGALPACFLAAGACGYEAAGLYGCYRQAHGQPFPDLPEPPPGDVPQRGNFGLP